jgi:hypothetical protein
MGPYQDSLDEVYQGLDGQGSTVLEMDGYRGLLLVAKGVGILCLVRGREDDAFRQVLEAQLETLSQELSEGAALATIDDVLSAAGKPTRAAVVKGAWTARLATKLSYKGSLVSLYVGLRNDTGAILNNVRLQLHYDRDALALASVRPKMLVSKGRVSMGNVPPRKDQRLEITFVPELCMSSKIRAVATYTDVEGQQVTVPAKTVPIEVECPYIEPGGEMDEARLLTMSEEGLGQSGLRVFTYGIDVDRNALFKMAVQLVVERGPMKVLELDDESLMRSEAWFLGSGEGGTPRVLVRVASHGADHLLELFVTSDHGATATGLLTFLAGEFMDTAASEMPGKRVERVRDATTLEDVAAWPSLLDYKIMGE